MSHARTTRRRVAVRRGSRVAAVVLLVLGLLFAAVTWRYSSQVRDRITVDERPWHEKVLVVRAERGTVTLAPFEDGPTWLTASRVFGLDWGEGHGHVTDVRREDGDRVVRTLRVLDGPPPRAGTTARFSRDAFPRDPGATFGEQVRAVTVRSPAGRLPAWHVPGRSRTWAVLVHGRGALRSEMYRLMRSTVALGMPSLDISYRGDVDNGGGLARMGETEWRDVEAAVRFALDRGARDVVLLGCSMGGALAAAFLERSQYADRVRGVVLDSPLLDFAAAVELGASQVELPVPGGLPGVVTWSALRLAALRSDIDLDAVDYLDDTSWVTAPTLVLHGTSDTTVPAATSRELAEAEPERVEARFVEGAGHVESWNAGPRRYDRWVRAFLRRLPAG